MEIVKPAQLGFFAIYSPALGSTDKTLPDQLVYYNAGKGSASKDAGDKVTVEAEAREQHNEQLRQIGLAQGIVALGK